MGYCRIVTAKVSLLSAAASRVRSSVYALAFGGLCCMLLPVVGSAQTAPFGADEFAAKAIQVTGRVSVCGTLSSTPSSRAAKFA